MLEYRARNALANATRAAASDDPRLCHDVFPSPVPSVGTPHLEEVPSLLLTSLLQARHEMHNAQLGYWHQVHERLLPSAHFVTQPDRTIFLQQVRTSELHTFTPNAPENTSAHESRKAIPIADPKAHVTFHLCARADASARIVELFE